MSSEYHRLRKEALKKGWVVPGPASPFTATDWVNYWKAMKDYEKGEPGRPVPPHRTGSIV